MIHLYSHLLIYLVFYPIKREKTLIMKKEKSKFNMCLFSRFKMLYTQNCIPPKTTGVINELGKSYELQIKTDKIILYLLHI